jgi:hypothetical protein
MTINTPSLCEHCSGTGFCGQHCCKRAGWPDLNGTCTDCRGEGARWGSRWLFAAAADGSDRGEERVVRLSEVQVAPTGEFLPGYGDQVLLAGEVGRGIDRALTEERAVCAFLGSVHYFAIHVDGELLPGIFMPAEWNVKTPGSRLRIRAQCVAGLMEDAADMCAAATVGR